MCRRCGTGCSPNGGILSTFAGIQRAPLSMTAPVLRISPHAYTTAVDLEIFAEALIAATAVTAT